MRRQFSGRGIYVFFENFPLHSRESKIVYDVVRNKPCSVDLPFLDRFAHCRLIAQYVVQTPAILDGKYIWEQGVVLEIFANPGTVNDDWNSQWIEIGRITNPRKLENLNSANSSCGQNDFLR